MRPGALTDRLARLVLRSFDRSEVDDVLADLHELASGRGRVGGAIYFWVELLKYPVRRTWDGLRHGYQDHRRGGGGNGMESMWKDVRYAARALARNPGFTTMAVIIITVAMGATTAVYSVVNGVLLDPLPVEEPDRLVSLWLQPVSGGARGRMTPGNFTDIAALEGVFSSTAAFGAQTSSLDLDGDPIFLRGGAVTPDYFEALGVRLVIGRTFRDEEGEAGGPPVVVLSHHVWQQLLAADPGVIGQTLMLDGFSVEVIGVAPPGVYPTRATVSAEIPFTASNHDFFVPLRYSEAGWANRRSHVLGMIGRLSPGTDFELADASLDVLSARLRAEEPLNQNERILMTRFGEEVVGDVRFALLTLLGTVGLVLLIAIVNVGALFVLRADDRRPELAIRVALGAPRGRLLRQLITESLLITGAASVGAVLVARWGLDLMRTLVPYQIPRLAGVQVDGSALFAAAALGLSIAVAFSLAPALRLTDLRSAQAVGGGRQTRTVRRRRVQGGVVAIQTGLGVVVLVCAALFTRSYVALQAIDTGFDAHETWAMTIPTDLATLAEIAREVRQLPGVAQAAVAYDHPLQRNWGDGFLIEGVELSDTDPRPSGSLRPFGQDYFGTVGIEVVEGRVPDAIDMAGDVPLAVINEALRDAFYPTADAIGSRIILPTAQRMLGTDGVFEVVGVVRDVRFLGPDQPAGPALYVPLSHFNVGATNLLVRPELAELDLLPAIRGIVRRVDPSLAIQNAQRLSDVLNDLLARPRFNMMLLLSFGLMGLTLCGLGAYGLVSRVVVMRFREIGIRMALGAERPALARAVMLSALKPMFLGGLVGVATSLWLARLIQSLLYEVSPTDPLSLVASPGFVLAVGALAALLPTLRAISIDPASTLRSE